MSEEGGGTSRAHMVRESAAPAVAPLSRMLELAGERFDVSEDEGQVFVSHPQWSLTGSGRTVGEACTDLINEARGLAASLQHDPEGALSAQARGLRDFVLRLG